MSETPDITALARQLEANELAAWRSMYASLPAEIAAHLGIGAAEHDGALLLWNRAAPLPLFNRILALGVFGPAGDATAALLARARAENSRPLAQVSPAAPPELAANLAARGMQPAESWLMHARRLDAGLPEAAAPAGFRVERVGEATAAAWGDALLAAWRLPAEAASGALALVLRLHAQPGWHCYAAIDEASGLVAAGGCLFVSGGVGGLYTDGVRKRFRAQGLQQALIAARLAEARRQGCAIASSQTLAGHPAQANMAQAGFRVAYTRPNYAFAK